MLGKNITIRGIFTTILFITMGVSQVSLKIDHVDTEAGTLDIYMSNAAACSYCPDSTYNKNTDDWFDKLIGCENPSLGDTTWVAYDPITEAECSAIPSLDGNGGWWFDGEVGGFQFELPGVTLTGASGGSAETAGFYTNFSASIVLGFSGCGSSSTSSSSIAPEQ